MSEQTAISWADSTWSPWEGCTRVSTAATGGGGCDNCYAERMNRWLRRGENWGPGAPRREFSDEHWEKPGRWNAEAAKTGKRRSVFPSICDPFDNEVPQLLRTRLFALIFDTPHLDWLLLTKRIGNAEKMLRGDAPEGIDMGALPNLWLGATVVNQAEADRDISKLLSTPAAKRFISYEPALGPLDLTRVYAIKHNAPVNVLAPKGCAQHAQGHCLGDCPWRWPGLDWVIAGGESGRGARPSHPDWYRQVRDDCAKAGVPFHLKQWGEWYPDPDDDRGAICWGITRGGEVLKSNEACRGREGDYELMWRIGTKYSGRELDGREHLEFPK